MDELQKMIEATLSSVPRLLLEKRLSEKLVEAGIHVGGADLSRAAEHLLSGNTEKFEFNDSDDATIQITDSDLEYVVTKSEEFYKEKLPDLLQEVGSDTADLLYKVLKQRWPQELHDQKEELRAFKERLEIRWGKALGKLRMLLTIVMEWAQGAYEKRHRANGGKLSNLDDVMLRLHVRACQVTNEIIVLLENGYPDGAMARWRTLHEITITAAVITKFGDEIAERYVHYQIVESLRALKAYEKNHKDLGFRPPSKRQSQKVNRDYDRVLKRFGKKFSEENGWAAHHLGVKDKERITFARLEEEAGDAMMRSPYKMASYNVHASPKGIYFRLGSLDDLPTPLAGASNAGFTDPAQHAAVSLAEITLLLIGDSPIFDEIVTGKIVAQLESEIPAEFDRADKKLRRDDRLFRQNSSP